jgi:hypothetical protein
LFFISNYIEIKEKKMADPKTKKTNPKPVKPQGGGGDQLDLDDEDEKILDKIWANMGYRKDTAKNYTLELTR